MKFSRNKLVLGMALLGLTSMVSVNVYAAGKPATTTTTETNYVAMVAPTAGTAAVDGNISEWNTSAGSPDFSAKMCTAGSVGANGDCEGSGKVHLSTMYSRYDCNTDTMYILVLETTGNDAILSAGDAWVTIGGKSGKVVNGSAGDDGIAPDFQWVTIGGDLKGYEASFPLSAGTHSPVEVHLQVTEGATGNANTSSTGKINDSATITVPSTCTMPAVVDNTAAEAAAKAAAEAAAAEAAAKAEAEAAAAEAAAKAAAEAEAAEAAAKAAAEAVAKATEEEAKKAAEKAKQKADEEAAAKKLAEEEAATAAEEAAKAAKAAEEEAAKAAAEEEAAKAAAKAAEEEAAKATEEEANNDTNTNNPNAVTVTLDDGSSYTIEFVKVEGTTWTYRVTEVSGKSLSHWAIGLSETCMAKMTGYDHESWASPGRDGSTGFFGLKWDTPEEFTSAEFSFTLDQEYPMGPVEVMAKAGSVKSGAGYNTATLMGPNCDGGGVTLTGTIDAGDICSYFKSANVVNPSEIIIPGGVHASYSDGSDASGLTVTISGGNDSTGVICADGEMSGSCDFVTDAGGNVQFDMAAVWPGISAELKKAIYGTVSEGWQNKTSETDMETQVGNLIENSEGETYVVNANVDGVSNSISLSKTLEWNLGMVSAVDVTKGGPTRIEMSEGCILTLSNGRNTREGR